MPSQAIRSFELLPDARVESDPKWESTTLRLNFRKLDNSIGSDLALVVKFGDDVSCAISRRFTVYAADGRGGNLFEGDRGYQELRCEPYTPASEFASLPEPTISEGRRE